MQVGSQFLEKERSKILDSKEKNTHIIMKI